MVITITQRPGATMPETTLVLQPSAEDQSKLSARKIPGLVYEITRTPNDIPRYKIKTTIWKSLIQDERENFFDHDFIERFVAKAVNDGDVEYYFEGEMEEEIDNQRHATIPKAIVFAVLQGLYASTRLTPQTFSIGGFKWTPEYIRKAVEVVLSAINKEEVAASRTVTFTYNF